MMSKLLTAVALVASCAALVISALAYQWVDETGSNIPIVVVSADELRVKLAVLKTEDERVEARQKWHESVVRLKKAGYVVIDAAAVIDQPDDAFVPLEMMIGAGQ